MVTREKLPWSHDPMMRTGHYFLIVVMPLCITAFITRDALGFPEGGINYLYDVIMALWFWSLFCEQRVHSRHLCERCASKTPLDPQRAVTRWRLALLGVHRGMLQGALIAILAWAAFAMLAFPVSRWPYWGYITDIAVQGFIACILFGAYKHSRLQPWCPYCGWDEGGEPETVPDPDPALELT